MLERNSTTHPNRSTSFLDFIKSRCTTLLQFFPIVIITYSYAQFKNFLKIPKFFQQFLPRKFKKTRRQNVSDGEFNATQSPLLEKLGVHRLRISSTLNLFQLSSHQKNGTPSLLPQQSRRTLHFPTFAIRGFQWRLPR